MARLWPAIEEKAPRVADLPLRQAVALLAEPSEHEDDVEGTHDARLNGALMMPAEAAKLAAETQADFDRTMVELRAMDRALKSTDVTIQEVAFIAHRAQEIEDIWFASRIYALSAIGRIQNFERAREVRIKG